MTSREEFMRQMGLSADDLRAPPPEPTGNTRRAPARAPEPANDVRMEHRAPPAGGAGGQSRADFLRSLGIDNADMPPPPAPAEKTASFTTAKASRSAAPPSAAGGSAASRAEFLQSLGIDNADDGAALRERNATGSQEVPRATTGGASAGTPPRPPKPSYPRGATIGRDDAEEYDRYQNTPSKQPQHEDLTLGRKPAVQKAPPTPQLDAELKAMRDTAGAEEVKAMGNKFFQAGDYRKAVRLYTKAIELDGGNAALYSNRSAAYLLGGKQMGIDTRSMALRDADKTIKLKPAWFKGYSRRGDALFKLERYNDAAEAYECALEHDPGNTSIVHSLNEVRQFCKKKKDPVSASWCAPGSGDLHSSVTSLSGTKTTSKSAFEMLDEFQRERERVAPELGRGGADYKNAQLERFRQRGTGDSSATNSGTFSREVPTAESSAPRTSSRDVPSEFSSDAAREYQNALLESYRRKKQQQQQQQQGGRR